MIQRVLGTFHIVLNLANAQLRQGQLNEQKHLAKMCRFKFLKTAEK